MQQNEIMPELESLGIYQLRAIGHKVGVPLPTTYRKADLIDRIRKIISGEDQPTIKTTKRGRPQKQIVVPKIGNQSYGLFETDGVKVYNDAINSLACFQGLEKEEDLEGVDMGGVYDLEEDGYGRMFLFPMQLREPAIVKASDIIRYGLKSGDKIYGKIVKSKAQDVFVAVEIYMVNDIPVGTIGAKVSCDDNVSKEVIRFQEHSASREYIRNYVPMCLGDKILCVYPEMSVQPVAMYDLCKILDANKDITNIVFIGLECNADLLDEIKGMKKVSCCASKFGETKEYKKKVVELGIKLAQNLCSFQNKNVVLIIQDVDDILSVFDDVDRDVSISKIEQIFGFSRNSSNSSFTVIVGANNQSVVKTKLEYGADVIYNVLPYNVLNRSECIINLLESRRLGLRTFKTKTCAEDYVLQDFLEQGDYNQMHLKMEKINH